nr:MAG TPA: SOS-response transcriptional repressor [Caudoviricetes sp.]
MKIDKRKLDIALARKCWNQRNMRDSGKISGQTLLNINKGKDILPETAGKLARALGVDVTELLADS